MEFIGYQLFIPPLHCAIFLSAGCFGLLFLGCWFVFVFVFFSKFRFCTAKVSRLVEGEFREGF